MHVFCAEKLFDKQEEGIKEMNKLKRENVNVTEIDALLEKIELIDIREPNECEEGMLKGAKNIPMQDLLDAPDEFLDKDKEYYLICRSGVRTSNACFMLREEGYNVINVLGGMLSYEGNNIEK